jgi:hypothetical protein
MVIAKLTIQKEDFSVIYNQPLPDAYFRRLGPLNYQIPRHGMTVIGHVMALIQSISHKSTLTLLDLCCSYGINAMLLKLELSLQQLYHYFAREVRKPVSQLELLQYLEQDRHFFEAHAHQNSGVQVLGIDTATNALQYAQLTGLLDQGFAVNLEQAAIPASLAKILPTVDLITVTGGLSYIGPETFRKLLRACYPHRPWICCFPLRTVDCCPLIQVFEQFDFSVDTQQDQLFPQRLFASSDERASVVKSLQAQQLSPLPELESNYLYAKVLLARPQ